MAFILRAVKLLLRAVPDIRMNDVVQLLPFLFICKNNLGRFQAVKSAVLIEDFLPEDLLHPRHGLASRRDRFAGQLVPVDHRDPQCMHVIGNGAFSASNPSRKPYPVQSFLLPSIGLLRLRPVFPFIHISHKRHSEAYDRFHRFLQKLCDCFLFIGRDFCHQFIVDL